MRTAFIWLWTFLTLGTYLQNWVVTIRIVSAFDRS